MDGSMVSASAAHRFEEATRFDFLYEDIKEIKSDVKDIKSDLPDLRERITALEGEAKHHSWVQSWMMKAMGVIGLVGGGAGASEVVTRVGG